MQLGHHHFRRGNTLFHLDGDRYAATVINDGQRVVEVDGDRDLGTVTGEVFINGVVDDFINEVMKTELAG